MTQQEMPARCHRIHGLSVHIRQLSRFFQGRFGVRHRVAAAVYCVVERRTMPLDCLETFFLASPCLILCDLSDHSQRLRFHKVVATLESTRPIHGLFKVENLTAQ